MDNAVPNVENNLMLTTSRSEESEGALPVASSTTTSSGGANHARGYSADFVDDEEVESLDEMDNEIEDADSSLSNASSWSVGGDASGMETTTAPPSLAQRRFLPVPPPTTTTTTTTTTPTIAWEHTASWIKEHGIFLQAALDLLQERDKHAPTVGMMDPVVLKAGPLKKASILIKGIWKVKYVEIRRGMFSYYENLRDEEKLIRKDVPLQAHDCTVRPVKVHPSKAALQLTTNRRGGAIFEVAVGGAKRLWMASSRDERQSWMQAIRNATVGGSLTTSNDHSNHRGRLRVVNPRSPFRHDLRWYLKTQSVLRSATTQAEYVQALVQWRKERASLQIPVQWIAKEQEKLLAQQQQQLQLQQSTQTAGGSAGTTSQGTERNGTGEGTNNNNSSNNNNNNEGAQAFVEEEVERSIEQLWRDLQRDSVSINGEVYRGDQGLGPQGIMGALAHSILEVSLTPSPFSVASSSSSPPPPPLSTPTAHIRKSSSGRSGEDDQRKSGGKKSEDEGRRYFGRRSADDEPRNALTSKKSSDDSSDMRRPSSATRLPEPPSGDTSGGEMDSQPSLHTTESDSAPSSPAASSPAMPATPTPLSPSGEVAPATVDPDSKWSDFSEAQALTYARDILLSGNRTRSGGDSYFCINTLLQHPELVVVVPSYSEVEPVQFTVTSDEAAVRRNDKAGWISTRSKLQRSWKKLFFVLSEGILSYYERALPRPNGLRGQLDMKDATISVARKENKPRTGEKARRFYAISVTTKDGKERSIAFDSADRMVDWAYALECVAKVSKSVAAGDVMKRLIRRRSSESGSESHLQVTPTAEQAMECHATALGMDLDKVRERLLQLSRKVSPSVRVSVEASTDYKISTTDPEGDDQLDTWARVRTTFQQTFRLSGGPGGRILRGEEVVRVTLMQSKSDEEDALEDETPSTPRRKVKKSIFRTFSNHEEQQQQQQQQQQSNSDEVSSGGGKPTVAETERVSS